MSNAYDLISRADAVAIANGRLKDVPDHVDLEADRNLFAAGYLAAASSIKAALIRATAATPPVTPSDAAMRAAAEIAAWIFQLEQPLTSETDLRVAQNIVTVIITRHLADREVLEGMVAAFDNNEGDPEIRRITQECAITGAKRILGWPVAATASPETPVGGEPRICLTCGHEERFSDNEGGTCEKIVDEESNFCGCVCRFAAPVVAAGSDESDTCVCGHSRWDHWGWGNFACSHRDCNKFTAAALRSGNES